MNRAKLSKGLRHKGVKIMNSVMLVGKIYFTNEENVANLVVSKNIPNENGEYEYETIPCLLFKDIRNMCKDGTTTGIKGELKIVNDKMVVYASKISFLSSKQSNE